MNNRFRAIIGLGNPGPFYAMHRHNIGFRILDELVAQEQGTWHVHNNIAVAEITLHGQSLWCIKPLMGMNVSGNVVPMLRKKGIGPEQTIVIHDELEIPFGRIMIKQGGSARGHNGLRSFINTWGDNFYRLRCGIGRPAAKEDVPTFVLSPFSEQPSLVNNLVNDAVKELKLLISSS